MFRSKLQESGNIMGTAPHLRDWSEVLVVSAAIYCVYAAVQKNRENMKVFKDASLWTLACKNPHLWVFVALVVADIRIRQLWITRTLDDEATRFRENNATLTQQVEVLTHEKTTLMSEVDPLKEQVSKFSAIEAQLNQEIAQLQKTDAAEKQELGELRDIAKGLKEGEGDVRSSVELLQAKITDLKNEEARSAAAQKRAEESLKEAVEQRHALQGEQEALAKAKEEFDAERREAAAAKAETR